MKLLSELFIKLNNNLKYKKLKNLKNLMKEYNGSDWKEHILYNKDTYNRNIIFKNNTIEMIIISWNNNQKSGIHDHPENGCLMKILKGELDEHIYKHIDLENKFISKCESKEGSVRYIEGKNGLHNIVNKDNKTVTLHIYSPPNYISTKYKD